MDTPAIHAARFDASVAAWSVPAILSAGGDSLGVSRPAVAIDASGVATVAWTQQRGIYGVRSERSAAGWSGAQRIGTAMPGNEGFAMTADIAGNVTLLYVQDGVTMAMPYSATRTQSMTPTAIGTPEGARTCLQTRLLLSWMPAAT